jgi:hypothetical protein
MMESPFIRRERTLLRDLLQLIARRVHTERLGAEFAQRNEAAQQLRDETRRESQARFQSEQEAAKNEFEKIRETVATRFEQEHKSAHKEFSEARYVAGQEFDNSQQSAQTEHSESRWTLTTLGEAQRTKAEGRAEEIKTRVAGYVEKVETLREDAVGVLGSWLVPMPDPAQPEPPAKDEPETDPGRLLAKQFAAADGNFKRAKKLLLIKLLQGRRFLWISLLLALAAGGAGFWLGQVPGVIGGAVGAAVISTGFFFWFRTLARSQARGIYRPLDQALANSRDLCERYREQLEVNHAKHLLKLKDKLEQELKQADEKHRQRMAELEASRDRDLHNAKARYNRKTMEMEERRDTDLSQAEEKFKRIQAESKQRHEKEVRDADEACARELAASKAWYEKEWTDLIRAWHEGLAHAQTESGVMNREINQLYPAWDDASWKRWKAPTQTPSVVRFGDFHVDLAAVPDGIPTDERLKPRVVTQFDLPALLAFPNPCSLVIEARDEGRQQAERTLETVMFRLLTAVPPGKVRLTIIDPVGLGRSFGAFMHLADFDEALVTNRVWTEQIHIEQRLSDFTEHMEKVIQKFLRNQFATIQEYNEQAGEIAEPFRVLVVANFPVNFTTESLRRIVSIASSGARCGVAVLMTIDVTHPLPPDFNIQDLVQQGVHLVWTDGRFHWKDEDTGPYPLRLDDAPEAEFVTRMLMQVGQAAKLAKRVEVPFEFITPAPEKVWSAHSGAGIDVPLGRAGATKRQHIQLGRGTAQHVLIAGKTGSGKSTLLHAFITNTSLMYSPEEVELYLVDFKEGVEFKAYAANELPHARLVAIESEREFGLSVLMRIQEELTLRGDRFRAAGVQDINAYRQIPGTAPLPRVVLIVDEFQLFFVEDDKIAQDAALLLDRLVRQGRAFGIHVILGSQTLGGAYSLARSTLGQMAVRIALQCSEADAHLILSEDNTAARLLSRPGEAIYNSANGLVEGNDFFQVVWISDERREHYLKKLRQLATERKFKPPAPQIVFEGKAPADIAKNSLLSDKLQSRAWERSPHEKLAWLGEAMAIKDATAAVFRSQSGSNVIMVGQLDESALAVFASAIVSLAAQHPAEESSFGARFYFLDGSPAEGQNSGYLAKLASVLPHASRVGSWRDSGAFMAELAAEVNRRVDNHDAQASAIYLFIYGLQRFRDLRPTEDDFGFGRRGEEKPNPAKLFGNVLRDGPAVGVHTFIWCDTMTNVGRAIDRQLMREFEMRVLFQMSANDSSNLIDSPLASRLGLHRGLYFSEERGQPEKFRPYHLPDDGWFDWLKKRFAAKEPVKCPPAPFPAEPVGAPVAKTDNGDDKDEL